MTYQEKVNLADRLATAERQAQADAREYEAKFQHFKKLAEGTRQQITLLADARYKLWAGDN